MEIVQNLVSEDKWNLKCPYPMEPIGITVHNTANSASADAEIEYMISNDNETSFHFAVDEEHAVQGLPLDRNGWHASDGNGTGNRQTIGIEIARSTNENEDLFRQAEINAAELIAELCIQYNWSTDNVKRHYDYAPNHKYCPHKTMDWGWDRFLGMVQERIDALNGNEGEGEVEVDIMEEARKVVRADYVRELGREADAEGLENYANLYASGTSEQDIINYMVNSDEWGRKFINDCYIAFLHRDADSEGLENWFDAYRDGTPLKDICDMIYNSEEAQIYR